MHKPCLKGSSEVSLWCFALRLAVLHAAMVSVAEERGLQETVLEKMSLAQKWELVINHETEKVPWAR